MKYLLFIAITFVICIKAQGQDSVLVENNGNKQTEAPEKVYSIFKSTRVINAHSVDMLRKGNLDFRILHRFGFLSKGIKEMFGLDEASMRMSFDYGITDNITIGIGRSTYRKELDGFFKWRLIQQSTGEKANVFSLALAAGSTVWTEKSFATPKPSFADRFSYYVQVLAGRKCNSIFSLQLSPIFVHSNAPINGDARNIFAPGLGMRYKISNRIAFTLDYHHIVSGLSNISRHPLSLGFDIETGGHIFQLHFSNATGMNERALLYETYGKFFEGDIRFGFNLSRMFHLRNR